MKINGKYNCADVMADSVAKELGQQIKQYCDSEAFKDCCLKIMPNDGATFLADFVVPDFFSDIGCAVSACKLSQEDVDKGLDLETLHQVIADNIPTGTGIRRTLWGTDNPLITNSNHIIDPLAEMLDSLAWEMFGRDYFAHYNHYLHSLGTLGSGEHFIELACNEADEHYLIVHSGSGKLGVDITNRHKKIADEICADEDFKCLRGELAVSYLDDSSVAVGYSFLNHQAIHEEIFRKMNWTAPTTPIFTLHNNVEVTAHGYLTRKNAASAKENELFLVSLNAKVGTLICTGNEKAQHWNYSAPSSACDELIKNNIYSANIVDTLTPILNFKAK